MSREYATNLPNPNPASADPSLDPALLPLATEPDIQTKARRRRHVSHPLQFPRDRLALIFQKCRKAKGLSLADLSEVSGIDVAHVWRIEKGERPNTSREVLLVLSLAMVLDEATLDQVVEVANEILDAAGLKMLPTSWERKRVGKSRSYVRGNG
jgi:transcriptional regulator with XRE-family HTH domain